MPILMGCSGFSRRERGAGASQETFLSLLQTDFQKYQNKFVRPKVKKTHGFIGEDWLFEEITVMPWKTCTHNPFPFILRLLYLTSTLSYMPLITSHLLRSSFVVLFQVVSSFTVIKRAVERVRWAPVSCVQYKTPLA